MTDKEEKFENERKEALDKIDRVYESEHNNNKRKIKYGIYCLIGVPMIFLILLFAMDSSKLLFLVLWIASLFLISGYLVAVEYSDFKMQENFADILDENRQMESLMDVPDITDIDLTRLDKPVLKGLELKKERKMREQADENVALLMKQVAELNEKIDRLSKPEEQSREEKEE